VRRCRRLAPGLGRCASDRCHLRAADRSASRAAGTTAIARASRTARPRAKPPPCVDRQARRRPRWLALFTGPTPAIRTVELAPPSHAEEGVWVFLMACFVCLFVIYVIAFERHGKAPDGARANQVLAFQVLFRDLPGPSSGCSAACRGHARGGTAARRGRCVAGGRDAGERGHPTVRARPARHVVARVEPAAPGRRQPVHGTPTRAVGMPAFLMPAQEPPPVGGEVRLPA
jgi:hypothetical protein